MITNISLITFPVRDQEKAKAFYLDVLGFEVRQENPFMGENAAWITVAPAEGQTEIVLATWFEGMAATQGTVLGSTDITADHAVLRERGLDISDIDDQPWGTFAMFTDLDGNGWVLVQSKP